MLEFEFEKKYRIEVSANMPSETGIREVKEKVYKYIGDDLGWKYFDWSWNVETGEFTGKLPARIAAYVYKACARRLSTDFQSSIGDIIKKHMPSSGNDVLTLSFTKNLNWAAGDFGDSMSCFWGSKRGDRENIRVNGGMAVQAWNEEGNGKARVWAATTEGGEVLIIYNAYGPISLSEFARGLSIHFKLDYRSQPFAVGDGQRDVVFVNNNTSYMIGPEEILNKICNQSTFYRIPYKVHVMCYNCHVASDETKKYDGKEFCPRCMPIFVKKCAKCGKTIWYNRTNQTSSRYGVSDEIHLCASCSEEHCNVCGEFKQEKMLLFGRDGNFVRRCEPCYTEALVRLRG